jgi:hypothetical protein
MSAEIRFEVDLDGTADELERLQHPPILALESVLMTTFAETEMRVHVDTGSLKASGHPTSSLAGDIWDGTLSYDRYPGIFELARGPRPSRYQHDSHFFFDPVQAPGYSDYDVTHGDGYQMYVKAIETWLGVE